jgi:integrase
VPTTNLTKRNVDAAGALPGPDGAPRRTIHFDRDVKGFGLLVTPAGSKSFVAQYRAGRGRAAPTRRVTIGPLGTWTPDEARAEARRILGEAARGGDPAAERAAGRRGGHDGAPSLARVVEDWLRRDQAGNRSRDGVERIMRREVIPVLGARPFAEVRKRDLIALVEGIADRGVPIMANRVLAHTKRLFRWAAGRDLIETDPAAHVEKPGKVVRRDRVLADGELVAVWRAAEGAAGPFGAGVRLLIATGARREEVFGAEWAEVEAGHACLRLPPARNKAKEPRAIPLSPLALGVLEGLPRPGRFVVSSRGDRPYGNAGRGKAALDAAVARRRAAARLGRGLRPGERPDPADGLPPWRLHDLRRTVATGLQRLGARLEAIEAVLGHVAGSRAGIVGVYQRHRFEAEAREALDAWGAHVQRLLDDEGGTAAEVVPLRRA